MQAGGAGGRAHLNAGGRAFERGRAEERQEASGQAGGGREAGGRAHI